MSAEAPVLDAVEGQPRAVALLRRALAGGRVAHAWAFVGPAGSGRTTTALAFARALLCPDGGCGRCRHCRLAGDGRHPDLHLIVPTPPEKDPRGPRAIRIGAIRELERQAALRPALAGGKVFILDEAERMTEDAPQAFLKTLEEPPAGTVLILVLPGPLALPPTVLSRCRLVRFAPRAERVTAAEREEAAEALAAVREGGAEALLRRAQGFERDRERAERFVDACWLVCRDLLLARAGAPARLVGGPEAAAARARLAGEWTVEALERALAACRQAREALAVNVTPRLTVEVLLSRVALGAA